MRTYEFNYNLNLNMRLVLRRETYKGWNIEKRTIKDHELVLITEGK